VHKGKRFYVNFTESDGQTLSLCNRNNWQVSEETEDGVEELSVYVFKESTPEERKLTEENGKLMAELIALCINNWDNEFMHEIQDELMAQREELG
jgi:hypothetical protein